MMSDAQDREVEREERVKVYREEAEKEKKEISDQRPKEAGFIKEQLSRALCADSLEKSIKQRSFKSQSGRSMESNFARK